MLNVHGQRGGKALNIKLVGGLSHRLDKELVSLLIGKSGELVLN